MRVSPQRSCPVFVACRLPPAQSSLRPRGRIRCLREERKSDLVVEALIHPTCYWCEADPDSVLALGLQERNSRASIRPGRGEQIWSILRHSDPLLGIRICIVPVGHLLDPDQMMPRWHQPAVGLSVAEIGHPRTINIDVEVLLVAEIRRPPDEQVRVGRRLRRRFGGFIASRPNCASRDTVPNRGDEQGI